MKAYSSSLWLVEAMRAVDRLRLTHEISDTEVADLMGDIRITHETFAIHPATNQIFQRAGETFPTVVGTLDAIVPLSPNLNGVRLVQQDAQDN